MPKKEEDGIIDPTLGITTHKCENNLELVLCTVNNPLYALYVTIPTFVKDNKGLPHTLEHLIFCGSHDYPERGYLDRLATQCQAHGTNAYTTDDHTCYTFTGSSLDGLIRLMPVYLDHIFRPTLEPSIVAREVFHRDATGEGRGVVYCEMGAREWSEQDQLDLAIRRSVFGSMDKELAVYGWECGGNTKDLATLTLEEIKQYHATFYRPDNAVVVLVGPPSLRDNLETLKNIVGAVKFVEPAMNFKTEFDKAPFDAPPSQVIQFPTNDETLTSIGFAWPGPPNNDSRTITALDVLMRALKDTSASPLYQRFVEIPDPIASDIDHEIKSHYQTVITLIFSDVPTAPKSLSSDSEEEEKEDENEPVNYSDAGLLQNAMLETIKEWARSPKDVEARIKSSIEATTIHMKESLEGDPHGIYAAFIAPEIVRSHWHSKGESSESKAVYGSNLFQMFKTLDSLAKEPLDYWISLLHKYILSKKPIEVRMKPSKAMNEDIKEWERQNLSNIPLITLPPDHHADLIPLPSFELMPPERINCRVELPAPGLQIVFAPETPFKRLTMSIDLIAHVPSDLWSYLPLFQELFFQSDVKYSSTLAPIFPLNKEEAFDLKDDGKIIPYAEFVQVMSTHFTTFEASVGFSNELFLVGYADSHLLISLCGEVPLTRQELEGLALGVLSGVVFSEERIVEVLENVINQLKDSWGEASSVLDCRLTNILENLHKKEGKRPKLEFQICPMLEDSLCLVQQTHFLLKVKNMLASGEAQKVIDDFERLRRLLLKGAPGLVNYGASSVESKEEIVTAFNYWAEPYLLPKHGFLEGRTFVESKLELIPMSDITSSYLTVVLPLNILPRHRDIKEYTETEIDKYLSMALLCQLLSYTEGPLYRRIRGAGLAYGAFISLSLWAGLVSFVLNDSTDPAKAYSLFLTLIRDLVDQSQAIINDSSAADHIINEETLRTAQSAQLYQFVAERATPSGMVSVAHRASLRGLPPVGSELEVEWNRRMLKLTIKDLAKTALEVFPGFLDKQRCIKLATVPLSKLKEIQQSFEQSSTEVIINDLVKIGEALQ